MHLPDLAASAALAVSDIPFNGLSVKCVWCVWMASLSLTPTFEQLAKADMDLMVGATIDNIMMVEGEMDEVQESEMLEAIRVAHEAIKDQCRVQLELSEAVGKLQKREYCHEVNDEDLRKDVHDKVLCQGLCCGYERYGQTPARRSFRSDRGRV
ncbi:Polyribonucleotide nucleotidyltransferase [Porphyromonas macacae]|uniref:Polyribonucleotide nucleotidyltransferase n=1 Tax=Porphyromonas macacae TaxID=28115 RepID=A0A379EBX4_9PORP|nr:Polyribonucleotide nucleotidyltransferase [Porphyromonas macacae]